MNYAEAIADPTVSLTREEWIPLFEEACADIQRRDVSYDDASVTLRELAGRTRWHIAAMEDISRFINEAYPEERKAVMERVRGMRNRQEGRSELHEEPLSDLTNARLFVKQNKSDVRYVHDAKRWYIYDGRRWTPDICGETERRAKQTVESLFGIAQGESRPDEQRKIRQFALRSQDGHRIESMLKLARSEAEVSITRAAFDLDRWLLNCENGTIDLRGGLLKAHNRKHMLTKLAPVTFDPGAESPIWNVFLNRIMNGNAPLIAFLQRAAGYSLTGDTSAHKIFVPWGGGSNGKSTYIRTIQAVMGDYAASTPMETLMARRGGASNDLARLAEARFVSAVEAEDGQRLAEERIKQMTGGDSIVARFLYQEHFEFLPSFKLWLATNHKPHVVGTDEAIWRRIDLIPFTVFIPESERDTELAEKLHAELSGVLAWTVAGCLRWQAEGLGEPAEVRDATRSYRREEDSVGRFLEDRCYMSEAASVTAADLYAAYTKWSEGEGERKPMSKTKLGRRLHERPELHSAAASGGTATWYGVGIK